MKLRILDELELVTGLEATLSHGCIGSSQIFDNYVYVLKSQAGDPVAYFKDKSGFSSIPEMEYEIKEIYKEAPMTVFYKLCRMESAPEVELDFIEAPKRIVAKTVKLSEDMVECLNIRDEEFLDFAEYDKLMEYLRSSAHSEEKIQLMKAVLDVLLATSSKLNYYSPVTDVLYGALVIGLHQIKHVDPAKAKYFTSCVAKKYVMSLEE